MNLFQVTKKQPSGGLTLKTASGDIASFEVGYSELLPDPFSDLNVKSNINPVQDLHGEDRPYPAGGGVNLFDKADVYDGYINDATGEVSGGAYYKCTNYIPVVGGQKIYIMTEQTAAKWGAWYDENKNYISGITNYSQTEATAPANACFIRLTCKTDDTGNLNTFGVNYPSTDHDYHPYANICPINGYTEANITRCGVNLVYKTLENCQIGSDGSLYSNNGFDIHCARVIAGVEYTIKSDELFVGGFFTSDPVNGSVTYNNSRWADTPRTFTAPITGFVAFRSSHGYATPQLEVGNTSTDYVPYTGNTYTIAFGQTVYGGVLDVTRGNLISNHTKNSLGDIVWTTRYTGSVNKTLSGTLSADYPRHSLSVLAEQYSFIRGVGGAAVLNNPDGETVGIYNLDNEAYPTTNIIYVVLPIADTPSGDVIYELATPFDIDLTPVQIEALLGVNNVFSDTNGTTEVKYLDVV